MKNINDDLQNTVFIDESSIWTLRSGLYRLRKRTSNPKSICIFPPHSAKVHVWGGISWSGPTPFYLFEHNLDSEEYQRIITDILATFMRTFNGGDCRLLQDNAPSHVTWQIFESLNQNNIRWVKLKFKNISLFLKIIIYNKYVFISKSIYTKTGIFFNFLRIRIRLKFKLKVYKV